MDQQQISELEQAINMCLTGQQVQQGTQVILQSMPKPGFCISMMVLSADNSKSIQFKQMALSNMSNAIKTHWNPKEGVASICENDRNTIKGSIIDALVKVANEQQLVKIYSSIFYSLIAIDYPNKWSDLMNLLNQRLVNSQDQNEIYACLVIIQQAFDVNRLFVQEQREVLNNIITQTSPGIQKISSILSQNYGEATAPMVKLLLKIYHSAIDLEMCPLLADKNNIQNQMCFIKIVLDSPMPENLTKNSNDLQELDRMKANVMWKNKKWCARILYKFIQQYCVGMVCMTKKYLEHIPETFLNNFSVPFLETLAAILFKTQNEYVSPQVIHFALKYVYHSMKHKNTFIQLNPHLEKIMIDICLPLCCHNLYDEELYRDNADEYLRKEEDYHTNTHQNKNCAIELIEKICESKQQGQDNQILLYKLVNFIQETLTMNVDPRTKQAISIAYREGLLWVFGRLKSLILRQENIGNLIEQILAQHILPCLSSDSGLLRARGCWVFGRYSLDTYQNQDVVTQAVTGICKCLQDKEMPVKIRAAVSLVGISNQPSAVSILKQHLEEIFKIYIDLMSSSDFDGLVDALQGIVKNFQDDLSPYAFTLVQNLAEQFQKFVIKNEDEYEQNKNYCELDDDAGYQRGAESCLDAIMNILDAPLATSVYAQLENFLIGVIDFCLLDDQMRYTDGAIGILNLLLYQQQTISSQLWFYYPYFIYSVLGLPPNVDINNLKLQNDNQQALIQKLNSQGHLSDYLENIISPLKNYIAKGKIQLIQQTDFFSNNLYQLLQSLILDTVNTFKPQQAGQQDAVVPQISDMCILTTLYTCVIENNPGTIDQQIPAIIDQCIQFVENKTLDTQLRVVNCQVIIMSLFLNPNFTFQYLQSRNKIESFYNDWVQLIPQFKHDYDLERCLYGLSSVFKLQENQVPPSLNNIVPLLMKQIVGITGKIIESRGQDDSDFETDDENENQDPDQQFINIKKDNEFFHNTINKLQKLTNKNNDPNYNPMDDEDDDLSDEDYNLEDTVGENFRYFSPIFEDCSILVLDKILKGLDKTNATMYSLVAQSLSGNDQQILQNNIQQAQKDWEEREKNKNSQQQQQQQQQQQ